jgi:hypothetical protein
VWKRRLGEQGVERGFVSSFGGAAPVAVAPVATPRSVVFGRSEEERAKKLALLRSVATGLKMQPQMPEKVDPYAFGDPEPEDEVGSGDLGDDPA